MNKDAFELKIKVEQEFQNSFRDKLDIKMKFLNRIFKYINDNY